MEEKERIRENYMMNIILDRYLGLTFVLYFQIFNQERARNG